MTSEKSSSSFLRTLQTSRQQVAIGLIVLGAVLAGCAIWWGIWGFRQPDKADGASGKEGPILSVDAKKPDEQSKADETKYRSPDYQIACIWAGGIALLMVLSGGWLLTQPIDPVNSETSLRVEVLTFGGTAGFLTTMAGLILGYAWRESALRWINDDKSDEAQWVFYASFIFIAGLVIMFASLQLARSEQRTHATLRRVLYGFNTVFVGILFLLVLIVINVIVFFQVPTTLVANESAFIELSEPSKTLVRSLDRPATVYLLLPESHVIPFQTQDGRLVEYKSLYTDCHALLKQCVDQSPRDNDGNHLLKFDHVSPSRDKDVAERLITRFGLKNPDGSRLESFGLLLTVGEDLWDARKTGTDTSSQPPPPPHVFIGARELLETPMGGVIFQAENRLMTELSFLLDARSKEKVYFTTGHGELSIKEGSDRARTASAFVKFLEDRKLTVETLDLSAENARVPDDAAMVVVAGPQQTITDKDPTQAALREYVKRSPRPGKMMFFLPAHADTTGKVAPTGLESLLAEFGVDVDSSHRIASFPEQAAVDNKPMPQSCTVVEVVPRSGLALTRTFGGFQMVFQDARPVRGAGPQQGSRRRVSPLLFTRADTWLEEGFRVNLFAISESIRSDRVGDLRATKQYRPGAAYLAGVAVTESGREGDANAEKPRALIFGSDSMLIDQPPVTAGSAEPRHQFLSNSVDWLRERETSVGIAPRKLPTFSLEKKVDWPSQFLLGFMICMGIAVVGGGVWLSRRR